MTIGPRLRERREAELLSQFFQLRQQIYQWSPQAVGPQSGPSRAPVGPRARGDRTTAEDAIFLPCLMLVASKRRRSTHRTDMNRFRFALALHILDICSYHPGMGIYEHVRASAGDAQCRLAQQLLVPSEFWVRL